MGHDDIGGPGENLSNQALKGFVRRNGARPGAVSSTNNFFVSRGVSTIISRAARSASANRKSKKRVSKSFSR
jgi:hypothetical protein